MNDVFASFNKWIKANKFTLHFDKTKFVKFYTNNKTHLNLNIGYDKTIEVETSKFLGLQTDNTLNWKTHIQYIMPKLSSACFAMRRVTSLMKTESSLLCLLPFHHVIWNKFWGNATDSKKVFYVQKKIIKMAGTKKGASCRELFKKCDFRFSRWQI
jgi:hypothetical protein